MTSKKSRTAAETVPLRRARVTILLSSSTLVVAWCLIFLTLLVSCLASDISHEAKHVFRPGRGEVVGNGTGIVSFCRRVFLCFEKKYPNYVSFKNRVHSKDVYTKTYFHYHAVLGHLMRSDR